MEIHDRIRELRADDKNLKKYGLLDGPARDKGYTHCERYLRTMHFQSVDRVPNQEFGYWDETIVRWHQEGLPEEVNNNWLADLFFGFDPMRHIPADMGWRPGFEHIVLEDTDRYRVVRGGDGVKAMVYKDGASTIPHYLEFPLKNRDDWENEIKPRLNPDDPARYNHDWEAIRKAVENSDLPVVITIGSLFGWIRNWMGFEGVAIASLDDPELIEEIIEHVTVLILTTMEYTLSRVGKVDVGWGWEDICFNHGPIISPKLFRQWCTPRYKRITDLLRKYGADIALTDCDGNINSLVECWLDGGVNCMFPLEVNSGTDPVALRERFGQRVLLAGGVNKIELMKGKKEIEQELERLRKTVESGAFIPHVDHRVPPDVSYENYLYYLKVKKHLFGM